MKLRTDRMAYSIAEVLKMLPWSRMTLYGMIHDGRLIVRKLGRKTIVPATELQRLIDGLPTGVDPELAKQMKARRVKTKKMKEAGKPQ